MSPPDIALTWGCLLILAAVVAFVRMCAVKPDKPRHVSPEVCLRCNSAAHSVGECGAQSAVHSRTDLWPFEDDDWYPPRYRNPSP
jgi:hypothetical protein